MPRVWPIQIFINVVFSRIKLWIEWFGMWIQCSIIFDGLCGCHRLTISIVIVSIHAWSIALAKKPGFEHHLIHKISHLSIDRCSLNKMYFKHVIVYSGNALDFERGGIRIGGEMEKRIPSHFNNTNFMRAQTKWKSQTAVRSIDCFAHLFHITQRVCVCVYIWHRGAHKTRLRIEKETRKKFNVPE